MADPDVLEGSEEHGLVHVLLAVIEVVLQLAGLVHLITRQVVMNSVFFSWNNFRLQTYIQAINQIFIYQFLF